MAVLSFMVACELHEVGEALDHLKDLDFQVNPVYVVQK